MTIPILMLHGLFGDLSAPGIVRHFGDAPVYAPALLGYGEFRDRPTDNLTLEDQVEHVVSWLRARYDGPVHVVGHSVGGAVAMLFARRYEYLTYTLTSVEGNCTLKDAFWTRKLSEMPLAQVEALLASYQADPAGWLVQSGVPVTPWTLELAKSWLDNQPASTLLAQARAVIKATADEKYLETIRMVTCSVPIHLVSGARSHAGWDVPDWLRTRAHRETIIPETGHMMMLEAPQEFAAAILEGTAPPALPADVTELVDAIRLAWADAEAPPDDRISRPTYDDEGVAAHFAGTRWDAHSAWQLRRHSFAPVVLTAQAFAWLLPAYMIAELTESSIADGIGDSVLFKLCLIAEREAPAFLAHLNRHQRELVVRFLVLTDWNDHLASEEHAAALAMLRS